MQIDNIRVSRKLWGAFIVLMLLMLAISGFQQYRANTSMTSAMETMLEIDERIAAAVRWRGATETAVNMVMGGAVTTDAVLAQQYDARVKEIIGGINKIQEGIVAGATAPEEKAALDKVLAERKAVLAATAKTWELKGAGDAVATQQYADTQLTPMVASYLKAQDDFVQVLQKRRDESRAQATERRMSYAIQGLVYLPCWWWLCCCWPARSCAPSPCPWTKRWKLSTPSRAETSRASCSRRARTSLATCCAPWRPCQRACAAW